MMSGRVMWCWRVGNMSLFIELGPRGGRDGMDYSLSVLHNLRMDETVINPGV